MQFARVRSGLTESTHQAAVVVLDGDDSVAFSSGPTDVPFFYRSAIKPFQALAGARVGLSLEDEHLAVTCASHGAYPVHLAIVDQILSDYGLGRQHLQCAPAMPLAVGARDLQVAAGRSRAEPRFHNCSGKHAGWLAACTVAGWDVTTYTEPSHPLQQSIAAIVAEVTGTEVEPRGIDGCGAPTLRGSLVGLARAYRRLNIDSELEPFARAMSRFPALVADNVRGEGLAAIRWPGPAKVGAEGLYALSMHGFSIAAKALDGSTDIAVAAALHGAQQAGLLSRGPSSALAEEMAPPLYGGTSVVGRLELVAS